MWTGIAVQNIDRQTCARPRDRPVEGVVIVSVEHGSPGEVAGVKTGDIINRLGSRRSLIRTPTSTVSSLIISWAIRCTWT